MMTHTEKYKLTALEYYKKFISGNARQIHRIVNVNFNAKKNDRSGFHTPKESVRFVRRIDNPHFEGIWNADNY